MNDLDFDELDRAVNSLVSSSPVPVDHSLNETNTLDFDKASGQPKIIGQTAPRLVKPTISPMVTGSVGGRYMDLVPPTLKGRAKPLSINPVSRQGVTIAATSQIIDGNVPDSMQNVASDNNAVQSLSSEPMEAQSTATNNLAMPDSVDMNSNLDKIPADNQTNTESESDDSDIDQISNDIADTLNQASSGSPDSPFLTGAKVDKRPLGAFAANDTPSSQTQTSEPVQPTNQPSDTVSVVKENDSKQDAIMTKDVSTITPLPAELSNDLLSIEANAVTSADANSADLSQVPSVAPVESNIVVPVPAANEKSAKDSIPSSNQSVATGYSQHPSADQKVSGAVYDTNSYNNSLLHPVKKKSGWMMIVWIVLLLVVGAASGAAIYYFVLPQMTL